MDPAFVGPAMAREVTEVYFSRNKFCFTGPSELKETLLCDPFSTGSKAYQYIRNLQVTIRVEDGAHEELEHCYDCFRPLLLVDRKDRLNVSIQILSEFTRPPTYDDEQDMVNVLEALRYPVYELLHAGSTVDIQQYDGDESDQENLGDRKLCSPDQPAANFFQLTAEEWENEKNEHQDWAPSRHIWFSDGNSGLRAHLKQRWGKECALNDIIYHDYPFLYEHRDKHDRGENEHDAGDDEGRNSDDDDVEELEEDEESDKESGEESNEK